MNDGGLLFEGDSGPPWGLSCTVQRVGDDTAVISRDANRLAERAAQHLAR